MTERSISSTSIASSLITRVSSSQDRDTENARRIRRRPQIKRNEKTKDDRMLQDVR